MKNIVIDIVIDIILAMLQP